MRERAPQKYIGLYFQVLKYICIHNIQSMQSPIITWYGAINDSVGQNSNIEKNLWICERARTIFTFLYSKTAISFTIILLVLLIHYLRNIYIFKSQTTSASILQSMQFPLITYELWVYTDKTLTLRKFMYMRASGASELRKFSHFYILKLLFPSIFCWYTDTLSVQMSCLSAYMYRQMSKCTDKTPKKHYWGNPPPPPLATLMILITFRQWCNTSLKWKRTLHLSPLIGLDPWYTLGRPPSARRRQSSGSPCSGSRGPGDDVLPVSFHRRCRCRSRSDQRHQWCTVALRQTDQSKCLRRS